MFTSGQVHARRFLVGWGAAVIGTVAWLTGSPASTSDIVFQRHVVNADSEYSAVAVLDVNHDGRQDILCGGFWYEAPRWKSHFVREVERIRGRFDGYAHLPFDVNGDGWTDIITVNFRSRSIRWLEHPGAGLGAWPMHTVAEPGAMETGRLYDVDGDGRVDVLPNGQQFAAWWDVESGSAEHQSRWTRYELPPEVAGHGMGFGDIDGDGRGDVVGPFGWAKSPENRRRDRWIWHRDFHLGRASVPLLVVDVDEDGDNDIVWTRAHGYGVYWLEQIQSSGSHSLRWEQHVIDTSWSQCHAPLWADMDGDGHGELVAGKRYLAHEGRDPGAYDPIVSYRYQFLPASRTWCRSVISENDDVGFGLDPKLVDLDADGDLDLVVCGRSGLYWLENAGTSSTSGVKKLLPAYDHSDLRYVRTGDGRMKRIETPFDWGLRRSHIVDSIQSSIGYLPGSKARVALNSRILSVQHVDGMIRQSMTYQVSAGQSVSAELWLPGTGRLDAPGVICLDARVESDDAAIASATDVARHLTKRGYVCIVPEFASGPTLLDQVWTSMRAADVLDGLPLVDAEKLVCVGIGGGAELALLTAALDPRLVATVSSGSLRMTRSIPLTDSAFSLAELIGAIAPRDLSLRPSRGDSPRSVERLHAAVAAASEVFKLNRFARPPTVDGHAFGQGNGTADLGALFRWLDERLN